jgi:hypothetical protein
MSAAFSIRASAERAEEARKEADRLACVAWNQRMLGYKARAALPYARRRTQRRLCSEPTLALRGRSRNRSFAG